MPIFENPQTDQLLNGYLMNRLRIAHFTNMYHPVINGVVRSVSTFKKAFEEMGHNAFVFSHHESDYEDHEPFVFRYPSIELPLSGDIPAVIPVSPFVDWMLPKLKLDVIHAHHPFLLGETAATKSKKLDTPLVFTFHTQYREYSHYVPISQQDVQDFTKDMIHIWLGEYLQRCQHVVVPSDGMKQILVDEYGLTKGATVIPTGIDLSPYQNLDRQKIRSQLGWGNQKVIISVGRLTKEKNWRTLLQACSITFKQHPEWCLKIIGGGPEKEDLIEYCEELQISARVEFLGKIPFSEVPRYLYAADCFGFASITETQGLVTLEALAAGLPVVAVNATGTSDIVRDGVEGFITDNENTALANGLNKLISNADTFGSFSDSALKRAESFAIHNQALKLESIYREAIEDHRAGKFVITERYSPIMSKIKNAVMPESLISPK